jgi:tetratricopeptide (TPR) repeat protein
MNDLNRAIEANKQSVEFRADNASQYASRINSLGCALQKRFSRTGSKDDIDGAIVAMETAILQAQEHPDRALYHNNLGMALHSRFTQSRLKDDLDRATTSYHQAVGSSPHIQSKPDQAMYLSNLGSALHDQFELTDLLDDLEQAISVKKQAVNCISNVHSDHAVYLNNLATSLLSRFKRTGSMQDLTSTIEAYEQGVMLQTALPSVRIQMAGTVSELLIGHEYWDRAKAVLQTAVELLPTISLRTLNELDQQYNISKFAGITARAVSVLLECGDEACKALQLLELGRGVLADLRLTIRSDISVLEESHPELAQSFRNIRDQLDRPRPHNDNGQDILDNVLHDKTSVYRSFSKQYDEKLLAIRKIPEFERFLLGPSEAEMKDVAKTGPIVVFNVSEIRSDAFIVSTNHIRSMRLVLLSQSDLEAQCKRFVNAIESLHQEDYLKARRVVKEVLKWLWVVAIGPILAELGFVETRDDQATWPRVWWVGNGLLNLLPLHAAGHHDGRTENALDKVISSYTPTVKAFKYAIERQVKADSVEEQGMLLIGMPETPGEGDLSFVENELEMIQSLVPAKVLHSLLYPTRESVLARIRGCQMVHFSCHGCSELVPSESKLLLVDWKTVPLTVSDIASVNMQDPQFAYLSACYTARIEDPLLLDESINVVSAMQLAGFPSVVGTLWQVKDRPSAEVAEEVYTWMLVEDKFNNRRSAEGLHRAIRKLRRKTREGLTGVGKDDPMIWAPYIHLGV